MDLGTLMSPSNFNSFYTAEQHANSEGRELQNLIKSRFASVAHTISVKSVHFRNKRTIDFIQTARAMMSKRCLRDKPSVLQFGIAFWAMRIVLLIRKGTLECN